MDDVTIQYQLDLAIKLIDTTTGNPVEEKQAIFQTGGQILNLHSRDSGYYILMGRGRNNMKLDIDVKGYLPVCIEVNYEKLSQRQPEIEIALIPIPKSYGFDDLVSIKGIKKGIDSIDAVQLNNPVASIGNYIEAKQIIKLLASKNLMENGYAVLHKSEEDYECFDIAKKIDKLLLKLRSPLAEQVLPEESIVRVIRGQTDSEGNYLLRIRENGKGSDYLIRYSVDGKDTFVRINLEILKEGGLDNWESQ